jgi:hypothetical protein
LRLRRSRKTAGSDNNQKQRQIKPVLFVTFGSDSSEKQGDGMWRHKPVFENDRWQPITSLDHHLTVLDPPAEIYFIIY